MSHMTTKRDAEYESTLMQWRAKKYDDLVRENGWLALAGLHWLKEGRNLIGSNPMCEVALPLSLYRLKEPRIGINVRVGPVMIGSDKVGALLGLTDLGGMDVYMGVRIAIKEK